MSVRHRFLLLLGLRWLATGLVIPVSILLPLERGLSLTEIGAVIAAQGVVVLIMEVPSGALTDSWGRRPVFIASAAAAIIAYCLTATAQSVLGFTVAWAVTGLFRALDSGPLEAWFVDNERAHGRTKEVPSSLAAAGSVTSGSIAVGCLTSAALIYLSPWSTTTTLAVPYGAAIIIVLVQLPAAAFLMERVPRRRKASRTTWSSTLLSGVRLAFTPAMRWLTLAMIMIGIGVTALETFMPVRLNEFSIDTSDAGITMGIISAAAWGLGSLGAAATARVLKRRAAALVAIVLICIEAGSLLVMAAATGFMILIAGYWGAYLVHSAFSGTFNSLVHQRVDDEHRGTLLSMVSIAFLGTASLAGVVLGWFADITSTSAGLMAGGASFAIAAGLIRVGTRRATSDT